MSNPKVSSGAHDNQYGAFNLAPNQKSCAPSHYAILSRYAIGRVLGLNPHRFQIGWPVLLVLALHPGLLVFLLPRRLEWQALLVTVFFSLFYSCLFYYAHNFNLKGEIQAAAGNIARSPLPITLITRPMSKQGVEPVSVHQNGWVP